MKTPNPANSKDVKVVGLCSTSFQDGRNKTEIPPFFHQVLKEGKLANVPHRLNQNQLCIFKMARHSPDLDYIMGVEVEQVEELPAGMESITLPQGEYVVMTIVKRGQRMWGRGHGYI
jgi:predicted transcriptional regulator YdeE